MQFKQGTSVFTEQGKEVGHIDRVVIDPKSKAVTHIVVRKGLLFTEDKVVPSKLIGTGQADRITLRMDTNKLNDLPEFQETHYVALNEDELGKESKSVINIAPASYWYPPYPEVPMAPFLTPPYEVETKTNIPEGTVAVKEGAKVISRDKTHVGNVEQVLTSAQTGRATHFVIAKGLLLKEKKMIPVSWIANLSEDEVNLAVTLPTIEKLPALEHA